MAKTTERAEPAAARPTPEASSPPTAIGPATGLRVPKAIGNLAMQRVLDSSGGTKAPGRPVAAAGGAAPGSGSRSGPGASPRLCPRCAKALAEGRPQDLCPRCRAHRARGGEIIPRPEANGRALDAATQSRFSTLFGHDLRSVRVHTDGDAGRSAQARGASAFTVGRDISFASGRFEPGTPRGDRLLAHELAHVVQQDNPGRATPGRSHEREATHAAGRATRGEPVGRLSGVALGSVQRQTPQAEGGPSPEQSESLERPASGPSVRVPHERIIYFRSVRFANNEAFLRQTLEGVMKVQGTRTTIRLIDEFTATRGRQERSRGGIGPPPISAHGFGIRRPLHRFPHESMRDRREQRRQDAVPESDRTDIIRIIGTIKRELLAERKTFLRRFAGRALHTLSELLREGEIRLREEAMRYGIAWDVTEHWESTNHGQIHSERVTYSMTETPVGRGLAGAAQDLIDKREEIGRIGSRRHGLRRIRSVSKAGVHFYVPDENQAAYEALGKEIEEKRREEQLLASIHGRRYPILTAFADDIPALRRIAAGAGRSAATTVGSHIYEQLGRIEEVRANIRRSDIDVWKLPQIIELTKTTAGLREHSLSVRWVDEEKTRVRERDELIDTVLSVLGVVLGLVAIFATGGTALAIGAAAGSAVVGGASLSRAIDRYRLQRADSYVDRAYAISGDDPSSLWIALEVVGLVFDVAEAAKIFRVVAPAARRAVGASAAEAPNLVDEVVEVANAQKAGLGPRLREAIGRSRQAEGRTAAEVLGGAAGHEARATARVTREIAQQVEDPRVIVRPMALGPHSVKVTPGGQIMRCSVCGYLRWDYSHEIAASQVGDGILAGRVAAAEALAERAAQARLAGRGQEAQRLAEAAAIEAASVADALELVRRARLAAEGSETAAEAVRAARGLAEGIEPRFLDEAVQQMPEGLRAHVLAQPRLQRALKNADYNPTRLMEAWEHYWRTPNLGSENFVTYIKTHRGFVTSAAHVNRPLTEAIDGWADLAGSQRTRSLLDLAEPGLLTRLRDGELPDHVAAAVRGVLDDEELIRMVGRAQRVDRPRREVMRRLNEAVARSAQSPQEFASLLSHVGSPANRGSMGEWFTHHHLAGSAADSNRHLRVARSEVPGLNRDPFIPDRLDPQTHRTLDVKTGYTDSDIDFLQAQDYRTFRRATAADEALAAAHGGPIVGHDYLFLPVGTRSAEDAARRAHALLERRELLGDTRVLYMGSDGNIYRFTGPDSPAELIGETLAGQ